MKDVTQMRRMTRFEELEFAKKELAEAQRAFRDHPFVVNLATMVYQPFMLAIINKKYDAIEGQPNAMSVEQVLTDVGWVMSNMVTEVVRHMAPSDDLGGHFELARDLVSRIAANIQEDLNDRARDKMARKPNEVN